ncbi:MAG: type III-B CRISPR module RAMP protein Cmr4 [Verrucomicrobia bacterium]|nr:type III-B CRISPR module RAMP protein Cmr4 [Verrucomicrobiota bacterium]
MNTEAKSEIRNHKSKILYLFTRTPLHVGAGASVGAIDQPIVRERHTGFPVIPASSLKGTFADAWNDGLLDEQNDQGQTKRVRVRKDGTASDAAWLFGSDSDKHAAAGALQFSEARLLAFPIRSARGGFAWLTCPLLLQRAARDGVIPPARLEKLPEPADDHAIFDAGTNSKLALGDKVVLEEYTFTTTAWTGLTALGGDLTQLLPSDRIWSEITNRLVILSNGMMSFFAQSACEVAQHVRIDDETGTAAGGALFNQQNVPSETLFYAVVNVFKGRGVKFKDKTPDQAIRAFQGQDDQGKNQPEKPGVRNGSVFQFGGDASTGLGYCTVQLGDNREVVK